MTIPSFQEFLTEDKSGKLSHLQHLEDLILDDGAAGVDFAQFILKQFHSMLQGGGVSRAMSVSLKWDGSPSLVFGPDPADGQFFVATKAAFSKNPKLLKTHAQIDSFYSGELAKHLHTALTLLPTIRPRQVMQGDLMYTGTPPTQEINGTVCYTFQPNTIMYAVGVDSTIGQRIGRSTLGIVIHTMYTGKGSSFVDYSATPITPAVFSTLARTPHVVVIDSTYDDLSGTITFTTGEEQDFLLAITRIEQFRAAVPIAIYNTLASEPLKTLVQQFINAKVKGTINGPMAERLVPQLFEYIASKRGAEASKRTSPAGQATVHANFNSAMSLLRTNASGVARWFALHGAIATAKHLVIQKLGQASRYSTFLPTPTGLQATDHEGYVAVSRAGKMVKLVDRLSFSRANFMTARQWG